LGVYGLGIQKSKESQNTLRSGGTRNALQVLLESFQNSSIDGQKRIL